MVAFCSPQNATLGFFTVTGWGQGCRKSVCKKLQECTLQVNSNSLHEGLQSKVESTQLQNGVCCYCFAWPRDWMQTRLLFRSELIHATSLAKLPRIGYFSALSPLGSMGTKEDGREHWDASSRVECGQYLSKLIMKKELRARIIHG